jgi:hypothetical protein
MKADTWLQRYWRPMMAVVYMAIILFDFIIFPIFWSIVQVYGSTGVVSLQWSPLTLLSGGVFHAAMGAVLGVAAWTRGKEKIEREFTEEVAALKGDHSDWEHGFHSGCCAAFSYVLTCLDKDMGVEVAEEEFPMLDS